MISLLKKFTISCLLITLLTGMFNFGYAQDKNRRVNIPIAELTIEDAFKIIKKQTGLTVFYSKDVLNDKEKVQLPTGNQSLDDVLNKLSAGKGISYQYKAGMIVFQKKQVNETPQDKPSSKAMNVRGTVMNDKGETVPGISVHIKGTTRTAITNEKGAYEIKNVEPGSSLTFTGVGYKVQEIAVAGKINIDVQLQPVAKQLDEVVVTALGITREQKSLGYATQKLSGAAVTDAPTNGFINALSGKVAGLNLTKVGEPMGSSRVILRGESVLDVNSEGALIVVDGVPISTSFQGTGNSSYLDNDSPVDFGSSLTDLNPADIESITVLKGPAAAALYGNRAANGAIIVTTKAGSKNKTGLGVTLTSNVAVDEINRWPDYQYEYGQGLNNANYYSYGTTADGPSTSSTSSAWGPKFAGQSFFQYNSPADPNTGARTERVPWVPYLNNRKDFFKNGLTITNTASISGSNDNGNMRLSLTQMQNDWILPNTGYKRYTVAFSGSTKVNNKITLSSKINYTNKVADNLPNVGYNNQSIAYFIIFQNPNVDLNWYQPYWKPGQEGIAQLHPFSSLIDNPYLIVNEMINASNRHNMTGNVALNYKIIPGLDLMLRSSLDMGYEFRSQQRPFNTQKFQTGMYRQQTSFNYDNTNDFLLTYLKKINKDFTIKANAGGTMRKQQIIFTNQKADKLAAPNVYNLANSKDPVQSESNRATKLENSIYGFFNVSWKNKLFLDLTGRNDWSSALPPQNNSFFYSSIVGSASLSEMIKLPEVVNYAKVRASYASVGYDPPAGTYNLEKTFVGGSLTGTATNPATIPNPNLKPQRNDAYEVGTQWSLFKDRINLDVTLYDQITKDQILSAPIDRSTGYSQQLVNVGQVENQGIEVMLKLVPVQTKSGFQWQMNINWAANKNRVEKLTDAVGNSMILATGARGTLEAHNGRPLGDIYGIGYLRAPDGQIIYQNGLAQRTTSTMLLGNTAPDWRGGINNEFSYKGFTFAVLFDIRKGGVMYSLSHAALAEQGKIKETLPGRDGGIIGKGVMADGNGGYVPNNVSVKDVSGYYDALYNRDVVEGNMFDASFVKLREARLQYAVPAKWLRRSMPFVQGLSIGVYGRDLFVWTKFPVFDPETSTLNNNSIIPGFETGQFPSTRTMGANVSINF